MLDIRIKLRIIEIMELALELNNKEKILYLLILWGTLLVFL